MAACKRGLKANVSYFAARMLLVVVATSFIACLPWCGSLAKNTCVKAYADTQGAWRYDNRQAAWYYQDKAGNPLTGAWALIDGRYYCFDQTGQMRTGWISSGGQWYYCAPAGAMCTGWKHIDNQWYYFAHSGAMQKGWQYLGGNWYCFSSSGVMQTGWLYSGGAWYYLTSSGTMATGWRSINNAWYHFNSYGSMDKGWFYEGSSWYYLNSDGKAAQGWTHIEGAWYYFFPSSCKMAASQYVGIYWVNGNGVWDATQYNVDGLIQKVNQARAREGIPTLKWSNSLAATAALRAREAADYFSHTRPNGQSCFSIYPSGFTALGENLAAGPSTIEEAHQGWMNSPSHRACLLDRDFNVMGVACIGFDDGYNYYWVECFGYDPNL